MTRMTVQEFEAGRSPRNESALKRDVVKRLTAMGCWMERLNSGQLRVANRYVKLCAKGTPDLVSWSPYFFVETKFDRGKLSDAQIRWQNKAIQRGVQVVNAWKVDDAVEFARVMLGANERRMR